MEVKIDKNKYNSNQEKEFNEALNSDEYRALVKKLHIKKEDAMKNTIKLLDSIEELSNCKNCKSLYECKNRVKGYVYFPEQKESNLVFSYVPCKYEKKALNKERITAESVLENAKMKDIKATKNRIEVIKWIKNYYNNFDPYLTNK